MLTLNTHIATIPVCYLNLMRESNYSSLDPVEVGERSGPLGCGINL